MKSVSTYLQIAALAACFAVQFHPASGTGMPGTRKALQTLEVFTSQQVNQVLASNEGHQAR